MSWEDATDLSGTWADGALWLLSDPCGTWNDLLYWVDTDQWLDNCDDLWVDAAAVAGVWTDA